MSESNKQTLVAVIRTLNSISVRGKDNIDMLLGSILALEGILNETESEAQNG